jgi:hypothetical protein
MDWQEKEEVKAALIRLERALRTAGLIATVRTWDRTLGKGFDDYLFREERGEAQ